MQLCEQETNWEFKNNLPGLVLPCPVSHSKAESKNIKDDKMEIIKTLLEEMENNDYWTTNFASILYIREKNFQKVLIEDIIEKIKKDFNSKEKIFLSSRTKKPFESVSSVVRSVSTSIKRNKAFIIDKINNQQYISLDLQNVLDYLNKMHVKYKNDNSDITSVSSQNSITKQVHIKSENKTESMKLLGNKTLRKRTSKKYKIKGISMDSFDSQNSEIDEKSHSTHKYRKDNSKEKPSKEVKNIIINQEEKKVNKNNNIFNKKFALIGNSIKIIDLISYYKKEIQNSLNAVKESKRIFDIYEASLESFQKKILEVEQKIKDYQENKNIVKKKKNELNALYKVLEMKSDIIKCYKNTKFYGPIIEENKKSVDLFMGSVKSKIKDLEEKLKEIQTLEKNIAEINDNISNEMMNIKINDSAQFYFGKNEIEKDYNNYCKKIKEGNKKYEFCSNNDSSYKKNNEIVKEITTIFNDLSLKFDKENDSNEKK